MITTQELLLYLSQCQEKPLQFRKTDYEGFRIESEMWRQNKKSSTRPGGFRLDIRPSANGLEPLTDAEEFIQIYRWTSPNGFLFLVNHSRRFYRRFLVLPV